MKPPETDEAHNERQHNTEHHHKYLRQANYNISYLKINYMKQLIQVEIEVGGRYEI